MRRFAWTLALLAALIAAGCGKSAGTTTPASQAPSAEELSPTTPAATGPVDQVTWALYRETNSLDPIYAFDYPENTVLTTLCDSLLRQQPDGSVTPGLASLSHPDETTLVLDLHEGATFWDGAPVTAEDVVFSLERNTDAKLGGFYPAVFDRVKSIEATTPSQVTITFTKPDYWFEGEMSSMPGIVLEKAYVEKAGVYGTPDSGAMCSGPFKLDEWKTGDVLSVVKNDGYWDSSLQPLTGQIDFKGVPDEATFTSAVLTGEISGSYPLNLSTLDQLKQSDQVQVFEGPSYASDAFIVSSFKGALGDARVRQALSLALDRQAYIDTLYKGAAQLPRALGNPGTWGYGHDVFQQGWDALPPVEQNLEQARALIAQAGAEGETIVLGTSSEITSLNTAASALRAAAEQIGLKAKLKSVSAANYINFFIDAKARAGVDGFFTINYPDYADPAGLYSTLVLPTGSQNYSGYSNPRVIDLMDEARGTADPDQRAQLVVDAQKLITQDVPWIPMAAPNTLLVMNKSLTGAPSSFVYMDAPWAALLGAAG